MKMMTFKILAELPSKMWSKNPELNGILNQQGRRNCKISRGQHPRKRKGGNCFSENCSELAGKQLNGEIVTISGF